MTNSIEFVCPDAEHHGNPFRYCPVKDCGWMEETPPKPTLMDIQALARRCHLNSANWFPSNHTSEQKAVTHCTLGLAGEAGEVANKVKKMYGYVDQTIPEGLRADIVGELVDTLIYDLVLLDLLGADIPVEVEKVIAKCVGRWGEEGHE